MGGGRQFQPAADHRALERRHHRNGAELDRLEGAVPHARMREPRGRVPLGQFGEVEAGAEMIPVAGQDHRLGALGQSGEEPLQAEHGRVVERIAFPGARQMHDGDVAVLLDPQGRVCRSPA